MNWVQSRLVLKTRKMSDQAISSSIYWRSISDDVESVDDSVIHGKHRAISGFSAEYERYSTMGKHTSQG